MLSKLTKPVTFHVRNALKQHTQQQTQKAGQKLLTKTTFEHARNTKVESAMLHVYKSKKQLRSACSMALLACPDADREFWNKVYVKDPVTMRDIRKKLKIEYHMKEPEHLLSGVFNPKVQPGMQSSEEYHTCSCHQPNLKEAYIVTHQETGECILLGSKCIELMSEVPKEAKDKFKKHKWEIAKKQRKAMRKKELPTERQIRMVMVSRSAMTEDQLNKSGMHGHGFYDPKWNKDSISDWIGTWYRKQVFPSQDVWKKFPLAKVSEMFDDWMNCIDKSDYSTPSTPMTGFRKASSLQSRFPGHSDAEYANGVRDCLEHYKDSLASRPAPHKRVRELVTQPQAPAQKKAKAAAPKPRKPMLWDKVYGWNNGEFFVWDSRQRKMVSTDDRFSELKLDLLLNDGDSWDDIVWWPNDDGTRKALVIRPAYSFRTAYGAYGTTGHYLIIKPDQDEWTRRQLYSAIERAFLDDKESDGTSNPKPRLARGYPCLEGLDLSGRFFEVDGKNIPVLQCRWGR
ncbi:MAG: hypothetical protein CMO44_12540 [Verrucomicrobiales bacterium]|nr:hypothetical protein [Verrucomicrobiales bacterium]